MNFRKTISFAGARLLPLALFAAPLFAANITTLPALGANDLIDWSAGPALGSNGANPFTVVSAGGVSVTLSEPSSTFVAFEQSPPGGWFGHFPAGTNLIYDQNPSGPVTFAFSTPIRGFGLTIDEALGGGYNGVISEYNGAALLGSYTTMQLSAGLMFLGVLDGSSDITSVTITAISGVTPGNAFAFGNLSLMERASSSSVPEPASAVTLLVGLSLLAFARKSVGLTIVKAETVTMATISSVDNALGDD
jgi:hypothetical protein